jgi:5-methylcytosine-specific restriction protein B
MWYDKLLSAVQQKGYSSDWPRKFEEGVKALFGSDGGRYPGRAKDLIRLRNPEAPQGRDGFVPFAALIHPSNPDSGAYGGTSFAVFPGEDAPCLLSLVVGTNGLAPDEGILGRPGHARKAKALCAWLNSGKQGLTAWAKHDPTALDQSIPARVANDFPQYAPALDRYGHVLYAIYAPGLNDDETRDALTAFLDLMFLERGALSSRSSDRMPKRLGRSGTAT